MRASMSPFALTASVVGGLLTVVLRPQPYTRYLKQVRINGPSPSTFRLYLGSVSQAPFDQTSRGDSNLEDYSNPVVIPRGYAVYGQWDTGAGSASATFVMDRDI